MLFLFACLLYNSVIGDVMEKLFKCLDELIDKYANFIIMAHANPDLDALGSSLGLYKCIEAKNKKVSIFLNKDEKLDEALLKGVQKLDDINFVNEKTFVIEDETLLFVLDVHSEKRLEYPDILKENIDVAVLDHHIRRTDYIPNTVYMYINSSLSSMVEMITDYLVYTNTEINSIIASIMLAGLEIDTNEYNLKTTSKTYLAASNLMKYGADVIFKQDLLKENKDEYIKRADYIKQSFKYNEDIAMCVLTDEVEQQTLAEIADDLLKLNNVEASFVIGHIDNGKVGISTRSMGKINVEKIASKLGGGGSTTNAAAQLDMTLPEVRKKLIQLLG